MKKIFLLGAVFTAFLILILLIFNYRYPFYNKTIGNWSVGYKSSPEIFPNLELDKDKVITYKEINNLTDNHINYIADPFFIKERDTFYLFVELKGEENANIALLTSADGNNYNYKGVVLDEDFHLSYPQVFKYNEEFYMIPESVGSNQVLLYKTNNFPFNWFISDTLISNRRLKDPTILLSENLNLIVGMDDHSQQLYFTADSLTANWKQVEGAKKYWGDESRPGGRFFNYKGDWFLPMQNASKGYGTGISLYKLQEQNSKIKFDLFKYKYLEAQPHIKWFNRGMHHLDIQKLDNEFYMVYDGDMNLDGEEFFGWKRSLKYNLMDIYNYFSD